MKHWTEEHRVTKTLRPQQAGTLKLLRRFGDALVCVRYRSDVKGRRRYTTVELIVAEAPIRRRGEPPPPVGVKIGFDEAVLRQRAKERGARWDSTNRLWLMPRSTARALGLTHRIQELPIRSHRSLP